MLYLFNCNFVKINLYKYEKYNINILINIQYNIIEKVKSLKPPYLLEYEFNVGAIEDKNVENSKSKIFILMILLENH